MNDQEQEATKNGVSRRGFLKAGGAAMGAMVLGGVAGCGNNTTIIRDSSTLPTTWTKTADVIVIGGGCGGLVAALKAKEAGASVIVLEKAAAVGGDAAISSQSAVTLHTEKIKAEYGITDSPDRFLADYGKTYELGFSAMAMKGLPKPADTPFSRRFAEKCPEMTDFTAAQGVNWFPLTVHNNYNVNPLPGFQTTPRGNFAIGGIIPPLAASAAKAGLTIFTKTQAARLYTDANGRVVGVRAYDANNAIVNYKANKAVIVASGTPCGDRSLIAKYYPSASAASAGGVPTNTGDGLTMILDVGGVTRHMDIGMHWLPTEDGGLASLLNYEINGPLVDKENGAYGLSAMLINAEGKRFVNECLGYSRVCDPIMKQTNRQAFLVYDSRIAADFQNQDVNRGTVFMKADTLEELALKMNVPPATFAAEVAKYNGYVAAGRDEEFNKYLVKVTPISLAPFYAHRISPKHYFLYGGVTVDLDSHVLNANGQIIPGLYAVGSVCGSFVEQEGMYYAGGLAQAMTFGMLAGASAAREKAA